jgi:conjugal transfer pilus assembly protein TraW
VTRPPNFVRAGWPLAVLAAGGALGAGGLASARDFGAVGQTWAIAEPDLLATIQGRLAAMQANGGIAAMQRDLAAKAQARLRRPEPVAGVTPASEPRRWSHDPAIVVEADVRDHKGQLIAARGTRVNPLDFVTLSQDLVFVNGDDEGQVAWATKGWGFNRAKIILVSGSPFNLMKAHRRRFFFDQRGGLVAKFGIAHVPAVVRPAGRLLSVEEVVLPRAAGPRERS